MCKPMKVAALGLVGVMAAVTALVGSASAEPTKTPYVHPSGLTVVGAAPVDPVADSAAGIYGLALRLAEENPRDFGYPRIEDGKATLAGIGVHSSGYTGGSDYIGGTFDPCTEVFTDVWDAYYAFPGSLAIS